MTDLTDQEVEVMARAIATVQACSPDDWRHFEAEARATWIALDTLRGL